jgi:hypothetical protein
LLETAQPKFSGLDLAVSDGATQADTFRPLKGLSQRSRPDLTFVQEGATGVAEPFATDLKRKDWVLIRPSGSGRLAIGGEGRLVGLALRIGRHRLSHQLGYVDGLRGDLSGTHETWKKKDRKVKSGKVHGFGCMQACAQGAPLDDG